MPRHQTLCTGTLALLLLLALAPELHAQELNLYVASDSDVKAPGDRLAYTLTATNTGAVDLSDVDVQIALPDWIARFNSGSVLGEGLPCSFNCDANEIHTWAVGTLAPGEARSIAFRPVVQGNAPHGEVLEIELSESARNVSTTHTVTVDTSPLLTLNLAPAPAPAAPASDFAYTIAYGNIGTATATDVVLEMPVPAGASFASASDGGQLQDGVVTWSIGTLGPGDAGRVRLHVQPATTLGAGAVLSAHAEIASAEEPDQRITSSVVTPVRERGPLHVRYAVSQTAAGPGDRLAYTLTATNTGPVDLSDVAVEILLPGWIVRFNSGSVLGEGLPCSFNCDANEIHTWTVGTLAPGEARSITFPGLLNSAVPAGGLLRSRLTATSTGSVQLSDAMDVAVDPTPLLAMNMAAAEAPAIAGEPLTYTINVGNVGTSTPTGAALRMHLPPNTTLVDATCGGTEDSGTVTWPLGLLASGAVDRYFATIRSDGDVAQGSLMQAWAELDPGIDTEQVVRSTAVTPIGTAAPLQLAYVVGEPAAEQGEERSYTLTATNTGPVDLSDVAVEILLPGWISRFNSGSVLGEGLPCSFNCDANEIHTWTVGTLAPDQTRSITFPIHVVSSAPHGRFMQSRLSGTASDVRQLSMQRDVVLGTLINSPSEAPVLTRPDDGARFTIGGPNDDPLDPDSTLVVSWAEACDPEGDALTYSWQLSTATDFSSLEIDEPSAEKGTAPRFEADFRMLDSLLQKLDIGVGASAMLYHRVVVSDGANSIPSATRRLELVRGLLVDTQTPNGLPETFALEANYPNPFGGATTFAFALPEPSHVTLRVLDMLGREVATVVSERLPAGRFERAWDAGGLASGLYLYQLEAGAFNATKKMVVLR